MGALAYPFGLGRFLLPPLRDVVAVCNKIPAGGLALLFELVDRRLHGFGLRGPPCHRNPREGMQGLNCKTVGGAAGR
jgi:hypothetical protein